MPRTSPTVLRHITRDRFLCGLGSNELPHNIIQLFRLREDTPYCRRHILERGLEPLVLVLLLDPNSSNVRHLPDEDGLYPFGMCAVNLSIGLGVALCAVADADHLLLGKPAMELLHPIHLVALGAESQVGKQARYAHPGGISKQQLTLRIVRITEVAQERVEIVRGGGQIEPW